MHIEKSWEGGFVFGDNGMQAVAIGKQKEVMKAINMMRDSLASLGRVWLWGVEESFRWAMQKQAMDMYAYFRVFFEFVAEYDELLPLVQIDGEFDAAFFAQRAEAERVRSRLVQEDHSAVRLALLQIPRLAFRIIRLPPADFPD